MHIKNKTTTKLFSLLSDHIPEADAYLPTVGSLHQFHREEDGDQPAALSLWLHRLRGERRVTCRARSPSRPTSRTSPPSATLCGRDGPRGLAEPARPLRARGGAAGGALLRPFRVAERHRKLPLALAGSPAASEPRRRRASKASCGISTAGSRQRSLQAERGAGGELSPDPGAASQRGRDRHRLRGGGGARHGARSAVDCFRRVAAGREAGRRPRPSRPLPRLHPGSCATRCRRRSSWAGTSWASGPRPPSWCAGPETATRSPPPSAPSGATCRGGRSWSSSPATPWSESRESRAPTKPTCGWATATSSSARWQGRGRSPPAPTRSPAASST